MWTIPALVHHRFRRAIYFCCARVLFIHLVLMCLCQLIFFSSLFFTTRTQHQQRQDSIQDFLINENTAHQFSAPICVSKRNECDTILTIFIQNKTNIRLTASSLCTQTPLDWIFFPLLRLLPLFSSIIVIIFIPKLLFYAFFFFFCLLLFCRFSCAGNFCCGFGVEFITFLNIFFQ